VAGVDVVVCVVVVVLGVDVVVRDVVVVCDEVVVVCDEVVVVRDDVVVELVFDVVVVVVVVPVKVTVTLNCPLPLPPNASSPVHFTGVVPTGNGASCGPKPGLDCDGVQVLATGELASTHVGV